MTFADGSTYRGQWREGRVCGYGRYESAAGEVFEGHFVDGRLEGEGQERDLLGSDYRGSFHLGDFHGRGRLATASADEETTKNNEYHVFDGIYDLGRRLGRGIERTLDGAAYSGFYFLDLRHGRGALAYREPEDDDARTYEGRWLLGQTRTGGLVKKKRPQHNKKGHYTSLRGRHPRYPFPSRLLDRERRRDAQAAQRLAKHADLDTALRDDLRRAKHKAFQQQLHHLDRALRADYREPFAPERVAARLARRQARLDDLIARGTFSASDATNLIDNNDFRKNANLINDTLEATSSDAALLAKNPLSTALQSDFEELHEKWQTLHLQAKSRLDLASQRLLLGKNRLDDKKQTTNT